MLAISNLGVNLSDSGIVELEVKKNILLFGKYYYYMKKTSLFISLVLLLITTQLNAQIFSSYKAVDGYRTTYDYLGNSYHLESASVGSNANSVQITKKDAQGNILLQFSDGAGQNQYEGTTGQKVLVDNSGSVYVLATVSNNSLLSGNLITSAIGNNPNYPYSDYFLIKYDANGALVWYKQFADIPENAQTGAQLQWNAAGNMVMELILSQTSSLTYDGTAFSTTQIYESKIVEISPNDGSLVSHFSAPGLILGDFAALPAGGYSFSSAMTFTSTHAGILSSTGNTLWDVSFTNALSIENVIPLPSGDLFLQGAITRDTVLGGFPLTGNSSGYDKYYARVSPSGTIQYAHSIDVSLNGFSAGLILPRETQANLVGGTNVILAGSISGSATVGNFAIGTNGGYDVCAMSIDINTGVVNWANAAGSGTHDDYFQDILVNPITGDLELLMLSNTDNFYLDDLYIPFYVRAALITTEPGCMITGKYFFDLDNSATYTAGDNPFPHKTLNATPGNSNATTNNTGDYTMFVPVGNYSITDNNVPLYHSISTAPATASFTATGQQDTGNDIGVYPMPNMNDLRISLISNASIRPADHVSYFIVVDNVGTTTLNNVDVSLKLGNFLSYFATNNTPSYTSNDSVVWNIASIQPLQQVTYSVSADVDTFALMGAYSISTAYVSYAAVDETPADNIASVSQQVVNSYDPNDKAVLPEGDLTPAQASLSPWLTYTVRFQNTGNAEARQIQIRDTISPLLNLNSLEVLSASHNYNFVLNDNKLTVFFPNINLPDSFSNEAASHGYVRFRIKTQNNLSLGDRIENTAHIYFDYNPAIVTNTVVTEIQYPSNVISSNNSRNTLFPNPFDTEFSIKTDLNKVQIKALDMMGRVVLEKEISSGEKVNTQNWHSGIYTLLISSEGQIVEQKTIIKQ